MTPIIEQVIEELRSAWRFRWIGLAVAFVISICGWLVVLALPDQYEAYARVFVDTSTALRPVLQGLAVEQDVGGELNYVRQSLLAGPALEKIAVDSGVISPAVQDDKVRARIIGALSSRITLTVHSASDREDERKTAGTIYSIGYKDGSRARSLRVVEILLNTFVEQTLGGKRENAATAQKFLETQIKDYEQRLRVAEDRLAEFKKRNVGLMPSDGVSYFTQLQAELDAASKAKTSLDTALARRAELFKQIHGDTAILAAGIAPTSSGTGGAGSGGDTLSRIAEAQSRLDELLLKFTDKHPDVIAARQTLEDLKQRRAAEIDGLRHGDANAAAAARASVNPVYQSVQLGLNQADVEIAALRSELQQHESRAAELKQRLNTAPQVEAEYAQLNRDYDVNKTEYAALLANYQKSQLGEQADKAGSVRFEVVQPPTASFTPISVRRSLLIAVVLLLSFALGGAVAYGLHVLSPVVISANALSAFTGVNVLGVVGNAFPSVARTALRRQTLYFSGAAAALVMLCTVVLILNWSGVRLTAQLFQGLVGA
jgi:polysaccharide chain length determinant protein (PEP-CTERM system associated)